jgi:hypothetical protein
MAAGHEGLGAQAARTAYKAFEDRDRDALLGTIAEDVTWHGPLLGTTQGRDAVWEQFFAPLWQAPIRSEIHDVLDNGEHVVTLSEVVFDLPDGPRSWKVAEVGHYNDAGQLTERWAFVEREQEFVEFVRKLGEQAG